jgi:hypothetical protein
MSVRPKVLNSIAIFASCHATVLVWISSVVILDLFVQGLKHLQRGLVRLVTLAMKNSVMVDLMVLKN